MLSQPTELLRANGRDLTSSDAPIAADSTGVDEEIKPSAIPIKRTRI